MLVFRWKLFSNYDGQLINYVYEISVNGKHCFESTFLQLITASKFIVRALSELNSWCLENSLTPHSTKCEAMLLMKKTLHRAANFCDYWRGTDRVGKTYPSFGHYFRRHAIPGTPSHRYKKELC